LQPSFIENTKKRKRSLADDGADDDGSGEIVYRFPCNTCSDLDVAGQSAADTDLPEDDVPHGSGPSDYEVETNNSETQDTPEFAARVGQHKLTRTVEAREEAR
jgi:hypothetical protein